MPSESERMVALTIARRYPEAYIRYLAEYYGSRDFFECHEIMEEYWKEQAHDPIATCWLVLIRIPVALYHARRGNRGGALKLLAKAIGEIDGAPFRELNIDGAELKTRLKELHRRWSESAEIVYEDLDLPIDDAALLEAAKAKSLSLGYGWGTGGLDAPDAIVHRHKLRDRSDVVEAREASAKRKALSRSTPNK